MIFENEQEKIAFDFVCELASGYTNRICNDLDSKMEEKFKGFEVERSGVDSSKFNDKIKFDFDIIFWLQNQVKRLKKMSEKDRNLLECISEDQYNKIRLSLLADSEVVKELREELKENLEDEVREELRDDLEEEIRNKLEEELEDEIRDGLNETIKEEIRMEILEQEVVDKL